MLFRVTIELLLIFSTQYSPTDHRFSVFYTKRIKNWGLCPHQGISLDPPTTIPPAAILFGFVKNWCAHIFSVLSPVLWYCFFFFGQDGTWNVPHLMIIRYSEELCQSSGEIEQIFEDIRFSECHNNDLSYVS